MKYCSKCGNRMEDDMRFCQKCGAKAMDPVSSDFSLKTTQKESEPAFTEKAEETKPEKTNQTPPPAPEFPTYSHTKNQKPTRVNMIAWACVFGIFFLTFLLDALFEDASAFSLCFLFASITFLFVVLSQSPKSSPFLFGREKGLSKNKFVLVTLGIGFVISMILTSILPTAPLTDDVSDPSENAAVSSEPAKAPEEISSMEEVEIWYQAQVPLVEQSVKKYAETKSGVTDIKMTNTKFYFGESDGWTDCYYKTTFTCKLNGEDCNGETRGFLKVGESDIYFFDYELWRDSDYFTITEENDTSIDQTMEEYYHQLESTYR